MPKKIIVPIPEEEFYIRNIYDIVINNITAMYVDQNNTKYWMCRCFCGRLFSVDSKEFRHGKILSCLCDVPTEVRNKYSSLRYSAKSRNRSLSIDIFTFHSLIIKPCAYCGSDVSNYRGLDRIDNDLGYSIDNVNPCCWDCNRAKGSTFSPEDLFNWAVKVVLYNSD